MLCRAMLNATTNNVGEAQSFLIRQACSIARCQPSSRMFIALYAAASCSGVVLAFRAVQAPANSALAASRSWTNPSEARR